MKFQNEIKDLFCAATVDQNDQGTGHVERQNTEQRGQHGGECRRRMKKHGKWQKNWDGLMQILLWIDWDGNGIVRYGRQICQLIYGTIEEEFEVYFWMDPATILNGIKSKCHHCRKLFLKLAS